MPRAKPLGLLTRLHPLVAEELQLLRKELSLNSVAATVAALVEAYRWRRPDLLLGSLRREAERGLAPGQRAQLAVLRDYLNWLLDGPPGSPALRPQDKGR